MLQQNSGITKVWSQLILWVLKQREGSISFWEIRFWAKHSITLLQRTHALHAMMRASMILSICESDSYSFVKHRCVYTNHRTFTCTILFTGSSDFNRFVCFHVKTWDETILVGWWDGAALSEVTWLCCFIACWLGPVFACKSLTS